MRFRSFATVVGVVLAGACRPPSQSASEEPKTPHSAASPVVLVALDGTRWQDVLAAPDLMPTLHRMASEDGAVVGTDGRAAIRASGPNFVSLPGYTEMLTGAPATCFDNSCPQITVPTILDRAVQDGMTAAAFTSWERLYRAVSWRPGSFVVSSGRDFHYRPDAETADLALAFLERYQPDILFLALGDTDEDAHKGDMKGYRDALVRDDQILARLRSTLDRMGERGRATNVIVTADHGRAKDFRDHGGEWPESARVWLVATGPRVHVRGPSASPYQRSLSDVAPTIAAMLDLQSPSTKGEVLSELFGSPENVLVLDHAR